MLVDINSWGALAVAERWGGPWAAFCPYPLALRSADAHGPVLDRAACAITHVGMSAGAYATANDQINAWTSANCKQSG